MAVREASRVEPEWQSLATGGKVFGHRGAPVVVIEFSDFECPYCHAFAEVLDSIETLHPDGLEVWYRSYPLSIHPRAHDVAIAAECAAAEGVFKSFHDSVFARRQFLDPNSWVPLLSHLGAVRLPQFQDCLASDVAIRGVMQDSIAGAKRGIMGTPLVFLNGHRFDGAPSVRVMDSTIHELGLLPRHHESLSASRGS
jgi:protein-disulfide isomerase